MSASPPKTAPISPRKRSISDSELAGGQVAGGFESENQATGPVEADILPEDNRSTSITPGNDGTASNGTAVSEQDPHSPQPAKKRKLRDADKEEKQRKKELRERQKAEKRAKADEEKRAKEQDRRQKEAEKKRREDEREEERRKKAAEKEEKKLLKEAERKAKEEEKEKRDGEKNKKDKAQTRLNTFFQGSKEPPTQVSAEGPNLTDNTFGSLAEPTAASLKVLSATNSRSSTPSKSSSPQKPLQHPAQSDYERAFLPFFIQSHVVLAPSDRFRLTQNSQSVCSAIDDYLQSKGATTGQGASWDAVNMGDVWPIRRTRKWGPRRTSWPTVKDLMIQISDPAERPIDLTAIAKSSSVPNPLGILHTIPIKHLQYAEDVRPAYRGTFSRQLSVNSAIRLGRNPFARTLPDISYEYDSEAEWEEPDLEDGEDLDTEGEEDVGSEEDAEEMEGFLDDEGLEGGAPNPVNRRRIVGGDLTPVCTGLCWEDTGGSTQAADTAGATTDWVPNNFRLGLLMEDIQLPIDPHATYYWPTPGLAHNVSTVNGETKNLAVRKGLHPMGPPRVPLHAISRANAAVNKLTLVDLAGNTVNGSASASKRSRQIISSECLEDFRSAVQGSDLTKTGLIEVLKKKFPKTSKDVIKDTLTAIASRVGLKEADKRWMLIDGP